MASAANFSDTVTYSPSLRIPMSSPSFYNNHLFTSTNTYRNVAFKLSCLLYSKFERWFCIIDLAMGMTCVPDCNFGCFHPKTNMYLSSHVWLSKLATSLFKVHRHPDLRLPSAMAFSPQRSWSLILIFNCLLEFSIMWNSIWIPRIKTFLSDLGYKSYPNWIKTQQCKVEQKIFDF